MKKQSKKRKDGKTMLLSEEGMKASLDGLLTNYPGFTILVSSIPNNPKAYRFATFIKKYLESKGWDVRGVQIFDVPIVGILITKLATPNWLAIGVGEGVPEE